MHRRSWIAVLATIGIVYSGTTVRAEQSIVHQTERGPRQSPARSQIGGPCAVGGLVIAAASLGYAIYKGQQEPSRVCTSNTTTVCTASGAAPFPPERRRIGLPAPGYTITWVTSTTTTYSGITAGGDDTMTVDLPADLTDYAPSPDFLLSGLERFHLHGADSLAIAYENYTVGADLFHATETSPFLAIEQSDSTAFGFVRASAGDLPLQFRVSASGMDLLTVDSTDTSAQVSYTLVIGSRELGTHFFAAAYVSAGAMPVAYGDIPASAYTASPGMLSLPSFSRTFTVTMPSGIDTLNCLVAFTIRATIVRGPATAIVPTDLEASSLGLGPVAPNPTPGLISFVAVGREWEVAEIAIFDVRGRLISRVFRGTIEPGGRRFAVDLRRLPLTTGVYFVRMRSRSGEQSRRVVLLR